MLRGHTVSNLKSTPTQGIGFFELLQPLQRFTRKASPGNPQVRARGGCRLHVAGACASCVPCVCAGSLPQQHGENKFIHSEHEPAHA